MQGFIEKTKQLISTIQPTMNFQKKTLRNMLAHKAVERLANKKGLIDPFQCYVIDDKDSSIHKMTSTRSKTKKKLIARSARPGSSLASHRDTQLSPLEEQGAGQERPYSPSRTHYSFFVVDEAKKMALGVHRQIGHNRFKYRPISLFSNPGIYARCNHLYYISISYSIYI